MKKLRSLVGWVGLFLPLSVSSTSSAGDWLWPLYNRDKAPISRAVIAGQPRPAVWSTMGEYQNYGDAYGHPGHDIRGEAGDVVLIPVTATVERVYFDHAQCDASNRYSCRMWFRDSSTGVLFYMSHVDGRPDPISGDILEVTIRI